MQPLIPFLTGVMTFAEPCYGDGDLIRHLEEAGRVCKFKCDIKHGPAEDALAQHTFGQVDAIITNPPWERPILHPMIRHFQQFAPTWLLFEHDWLCTDQAGPLLDQCSHVVAVGRIRWIADSKGTGFDNVDWFRFDKQHTGGPRFFNNKVPVPRGGRRVIEPTPALAAEVA